MRTSGLAMLIGLLVVLFGLRLVMFKVNEWEQVVITQFGEPKRVIKDPGLYFKMPDPIQKVTVFGKWLLDYDSSPDPIITKDKKILKLDNYARWRIADPLLFLQVLRTESEGISRLDDIIYSELRKELGQHELSEVVSTNREELMTIADILLASIAGVGTIHAAVKSNQPAIDRFFMALFRGKKKKIFARRRLLPRRALDPFTFSRTERR